MTPASHLAKDLRDWDVARAYWRCAGFSRVDGSLRLRLCVSCARWAPSQRFEWPPYFQDDGAVAVQPYCGDKDECTAARAANALRGTL